MGSNTYGASGSRARCQASHKSEWRRCRGEKRDTAGWWRFRSSIASNECRMSREGRHRTATDSCHCRLAAVPSSSVHLDIQLGAGSHNCPAVRACYLQTLVHWDIPEGLLLLLLNHIRSSSHSILHEERDHRSCCCCCGIAVEQKLELVAEQRLLRKQMKHCD